MSALGRSDGEGYYPDYQANDNSGPYGNTGFAPLVTVGTRQDLHDFEGTAQVWQMQGGICIGNVYSAIALDALRLRSILVPSG